MSKKEVMGVIGVGLDNVNLAVQGTLCVQSGSKYGQPDDCEADDIEFQPIRWWLEDDTGVEIETDPAVVDFFRNRLADEVIEDAMYYG